MMHFPIRGLLGVMKHSPFTSTHCSVSLPFGQMASLPGSAWRRVFSTSVELSRAPEAHSFTRWENPPQQRLFPLPWTGARGGVPKAEGEPLPPAGQHPPNKEEG